MHKVKKIIFVTQSNDSCYTIIFIYHSDTLLNEIH